MSNRKSGADAYLIIREHPKNLFGRAIDEINSWADPSAQITYPFNAPVLLEAYLHFLCLIHWCEENALHQFAFSPNGTFFFESKDDAMLFKLTWI